MKYAYTIIYVNDVEETLVFYQEVFGFERKFITPEKDYGELLSGETTLAFASIGLGESNFQQPFLSPNEANRPLGVELAFVTHNIEADFQHAIKSGAREFEPLTQKPWGQKVGYLLDNNGFIIELCTPMQS